MPTIVFANPKGGVGKSTAAILLAAELISRKAAVTAIDADPNTPLSQWAVRSVKSGAMTKIAESPGSLTVSAKNSERMTVITNSSEHTVIDTIEKAATETPFVVVDLEGTASMMVGYAMSRADLVIIPVQGSYLDAAEAVKTIALVQAQERAFRRTIPYAVLFTRTNPLIRARTFQSVESQLISRKIPILDSQIHEREAYRAIFSFGGTLNSLDPNQVPNIAAAKANAIFFASEVVKFLKAGKPAEDSASTAATEVA